MTGSDRKEALRLLSASLFGLAALIWLALTLLSDSGRPLHIATTLLFAGAAAVWFVNHLVGRSKA